MGLGMNVHREKIVSWLANSILINLTSQNFKINPTRLMMEQRPPHRQHSSAMEDVFHEVGSGSTSRGIHVQGAGRMGCPLLFGGIRFYLIWCPSQADGDCSKVAWKSSVYAAVCRDMGGAASKLAAQMKHRRVERDLDNKVVEALRERAGTRKKTFKLVNSITMRLPRFKDGLRDVRPLRAGDSNGTIDNEEPRSCLRKLQVQMSEKEVDDVHGYCDTDNREGIQFQEFVVLLCLTYMLFGPNVTRQVSEFESAKLN